MNDLHGRGILEMDSQYPGVKEGREEHEEVYGEW